MLLSCTLFATWLNVDVGLLLLLSLPMPPGRDTSGILSGDAVVVICDFNQKQIRKNFSRNWRSKTYLPRCLIKRALSQLDQDYYPRKSPPRVFVGPVPLPLSADRSYLPPRGSRSVSLIHHYLQVKKYEISVTSAICLRSCKSTQFQIALTLREVIVVALHARILGSVMSTRTRVATENSNREFFTRYHLARCARDAIIVTHNIAKFLAIRYSMSLVHGFLKDFHSDCSLTKFASLLLNL